jgi:hypothetical protein
MTTPAKKEGKIGDKERLEWLAWNWKRENMLRWCEWAMTIDCKPQCLREAIDSAIRAERKGKL